MPADETVSVDLKVRTEIKCACGETHPIIEWSTWGIYASVPVIECRQVPTGNMQLVDTNYLKVNDEYAFPTYRGKLWVIGAR